MGTTALGWWIGVLFAIGAACFTIGPFPGYAEAVGTRADAITFFVGSIFFTSAAFLQYVQAVNAPRDLELPLRKQHLKVWAWEPGRIDWEATAVQFVGTVFFNITTFAAIDATLSTQQADACRVGPRRRRLGVLPRRELARVDGGRARFVVVGPAQPLVVDLRAEHARLDRLRRVGRRRVLRARPPATCSTPGS